MGKLEKLRDFLASMVKIAERSAPVSDSERRRLMALSFLDDVLGSFQETFERRVAISAHTRTKKKERSFVEELLHDIATQVVSSDGFDAVLALEERSFFVALLLADMRARYVLLYWQGKKYVVYGEKPKVAKCLTKSEAKKLGFKEATIVEDGIIHGYYRGEPALLISVKKARWVKTIREFMEVRIECLDGESGGGTEKASKSEG